MPAKQKIFTHDRQLFWASGHIASVRRTQHVDVQLVRESMVARDYVQSKPKLRDEHNPSRKRDAMSMLVVNRTLFELTIDVGALFSVGGGGGSSPWAWCARKRRGRSVLMPAGLPAATFTPIWSTSPLITDGLSRRGRLASPTIVRARTHVYRELPAWRRDTRACRAWADSKYTPKNVL